MVEPLGDYYVDPHVPACGLLHRSSLHPAAELNHTGRRSVNLTQDGTQRRWTWFDPKRSAPLDGGAALRAMWLDRAGWHQLRRAGHTVKDPT